MAMSSWFTPGKCWSSIVPVVYQTVGLIIPSKREPGANPSTGSPESQGPHDHWLHHNDLNIGAYIGPNFPMDASIWISTVLVKNIKKPYGVCSVHPHHPHIPVYSLLSSSIPSVSPFSHILSILSPSALILSHCSPNPRFIPRFILII